MLFNHERAIFRAIDVLELGMQLDHNVICQFQLLCTERWENLTPIVGDVQKRFCTLCKNPVYLTSSYAELEANIAASRCVAIFLANPEEIPMEYMGFVLPEGPGVGNRDIFTKQIEHLEISFATASALKIKNVTLVGDLVVCTDAQLAEQFGITSSQLDEIKETLASFGLTTGMMI